ncbi:hypothetical protein GCM10009021_02970 [Halarchaeum nitratireducens]|uniref:Uncharacterized protein n=1 Tax=Halarchaeum nitratireducens TaxID=489913 RepID=A0A830G7C3_9EURY|nr:hypothetical protein GCM10009021_02970 [Halarchaeum nitratireducens]
MSAHRNHVRARRRVRRHVRDADAPARLHEHGRLEAFARLAHRLGRRVVHEDDVRARAGGAFGLRHGLHLDVEHALGGVHARDDAASLRDEARGRLAREIVRHVVVAEVRAEPALGVRARHRHGTPSSA